MQRRFYNWLQILIKLLRLLCYFLAYQKQQQKLFAKPNGSGLSQIPSFSPAQVVGSKSTTLFGEETLAKPMSAAARTTKSAGSRRELNAQCRLLKWSRPNAMERRNVCSTEISTEFLETRAKRRRNTWPSTTNAITRPMTPQCPSARPISKEEQIHFHVLKGKKSSSILHLGDEKRITCK